MSEAWFLLQSGPGEADGNMALDEALLESAPQIARPVLRFYSWIRAAASFGYSQKYSKIERVTLLRPLVRRPTGGGLVPHDADWTYSLVFPPEHFWYSLKATESYEKVHAWIRDAFARLGVATILSPSRQKDLPGQCFIGAEKFDLLWQGRKIAGAAQRRTRQGLLIQGSVQPPPIPLAKADWQKAMCDVAHEQWAARWTKLELSGELKQKTMALAKEKYSQPGFNQKR